MKKIIIITAILIGILCINKSKVLIPEESIRFRVISSSNTNEDIRIKKKIVKSLKNKIYSIESNNIEETRNNINNEIKNIEEIINSILVKNNYQKGYSINYGNNYFPKKTYKGIEYEAGEYESLVITLGEGNGNNFWCVLFPPLCKIDNNIEDVEYKSFIVEIINKLIKKS